MEEIFTGILSPQIFHYVITSNTYDSWRKYRQLSCVCMAIMLITTFGKQTLGKSYCVNESLGTRRMDTLQLCIFNIWEADTREELLCERKLRNTKDGYAAAVYFQHLGSDTGGELLSKWKLRNTKDGYAAAVYFLHLWPPWAILHHEIIYNESILIWSIISCCYAYMYLWKYYLPLFWEFATSMWCHLCSMTVWQNDVGN